RCWPAAGAGPAAGRGVPGTMICVFFSPFSALYLVHPKVHMFFYCITYRPKWQTAASPGTTKPHRRARPSGAVFGLLHRLDGQHGLGRDAGGPVVDFAQLAELLAD